MKVFPSCQPAVRLSSLSLFLFFSLFVSACVSPRSPLAPTAKPLDGSTGFPPAGSVAGWTISQEMAIYNQDNLFNLVDGQAESFFAYGFEQVAVQCYQKGEARLNVEIWRLATPADAYGLFTAGRSGQPVDLGSEGDADPGRRLAFWQDHFFTSLTSNQAIDEDELWAFARAVSAALPQGGERPALIDRLPQPGRVERSEMFFHEEMSIQMEVWLGGENLLGLSPATDGALARYDLGGQTARLFLVQYPTPGEADKGLAALKSGKIASVLAADAKGSFLGAVFGQADAAQAQALLENVLK